VSSLLDLLTTIIIIMVIKYIHCRTDVVLNVEDQNFHCHKVVLSAASPYFKAMFTGTLKEAEMSHVKLQGVRNRVIFFGIRYVEPFLV
jgi:BTB/POZ domain